MTTVNFSVKTPTGTPVENAQVDITLPEPGVDYLGSGLVLPTTTKGKTDANGLFTANLAPIDTVPYSVVIYDPRTNRKGVYDLFVPESEDIVNADDLVLLPKPSGVSYDSASIARITADRIRAEAAAEKAENANSPRYKIYNLPFSNIAGTQTATMINTYANAFFIVDEDDGVVTVPDDATLDYDIGTAFVFIKGNTYPQIDIEFLPESGSVTVDSLAATNTKLQFPTDVIHLVKVAANSWKLFNVADGSGDGISAELQSIALQFDTVNDHLSALDGWRTAFNNDLNQLNTDSANNANSIATLNNAVASLNSTLATLNTTIDDKITAAVPGLGDISASVTAAGNSAATAAAAQTAAEAAQTAAETAETNAGVSEANAAASEAAAAAAVADAGIVVPNITDLKALNVASFESAFLEGTTNPNDGGQARYYYDSTSTATPDDVFVVKPDSVTLPAAGRWLILSVKSNSFEDDALDDSRLFANNVILQRHLGDNAVHGSNSSNTNIKAGTIDTNDLDDDAITEPKIKNNAVTQDKVANQAIGKQQIIKPTWGTTYTLLRILGGTPATRSNASYVSTTANVTIDNSVDGLFGFHCINRGDITIVFDHGTNGVDKSAVQIRKNRSTVLWEKDTANNYDSNPKSREVNITVDIGDYIQIRHRTLSGLGTSKISGLKVQSDTEIFAVTV